MAVFLYFAASMQIIPALYDYWLTDDLKFPNAVSPAIAEKLCGYVAGMPLFNWQGSNNGCEARADALSLLLQSWQIPHAKAWVFGGLFLRNHIGGLHHNWNYHVAAVIPVQDGQSHSLWVIDPSLSPAPLGLEEWAKKITAYPHSYYMVKDPAIFIFHEKKIAKNNWYKRDKQNRKWMLQGLAGINGLTTIGKAALVFNKNRIKNKQYWLQWHKQRPPEFLMPAHEVKAE